MKKRLVFVLLLLTLALTLSAATGCEKNLPLTIVIKGQGVVHQLFTAKASSAYGKDSVVTLSAQPAPMWQFSHWEGAITGSANPKEITLTEPTAITAVFTPAELPPLPEVPSIAWCYGSTGDNFMPSSALIANYNPTLLDDPMITPAGYDVLVIDELFNLQFPVTDFAGKVIVTLDSGVDDFLDQMLGMTGDDESYEVYWDYDSVRMLSWSYPVIGEEIGAYSDAQVYHSLDEVEGFTRFPTVLEASSTRYADDIIVYSVTRGGRTWIWLHIGPHFGNYDDAELAKNRSSAIIDYVLELLAGGNPVFPPIPAP
ncbi:MAG TPA: hypothetical protein DF292_02375 [Firmicutes bacterium]|nr:hypothetical protein [Bacillota bacterium]